jgi:hypothetical protein
MDANEVQHRLMTRRTPDEHPRSGLRGRQARVGPGGWTGLEITRIEYLSDAVYGADLEAVQMSRGRTTGSLAFAEHNRVVYSTGQIGFEAAFARHAHVLTTDEARRIAVNVARLLGLLGAT